MARALLLPGALREPVEERSRLRIRILQKLEERLLRVPWGWIPCGRRALFQKALLRRSRRSRPSPLLRLALWTNSSPRYQPRFSNKLLGAGCADESRGTCTGLSPSSPAEPPRAARHFAQSCRGRRSDGAVGLCSAWAEALCDGSQRIPMAFAPCSGDGAGAQHGIPDFAVLCGVVRGGGHAAGGTRPSRKCGRDFRTWFCG